MELLNSHGMLMDRHAAIRPQLDGEQLTDMRRQKSGWDELRGSLVNDVAALNEVEIAGWYCCDRLKVESLEGLAR